MRCKNLMLLMIMVILFSCKKGKETYIPLPNTPPVTKVLLKEITMPFLPSPYYHFEYDSLGKANFVSFASDFTRYDILYDGTNIKEMRNNILVNKDRLQYFYDNEGKVSNINYADSNGMVYTKTSFTYNGKKLIMLERQKKSGVGFLLNKRMTFSYYADDNLMEVTTHRPMINGASEQNSVDRYEQYDNKLNIDNFQLLHTEFFDHLVYLPKVQLQKNNPKKIIHTGDDDNYQIEDRYVYGVNDAPLQKIEKFTWLSGARIGETFDFDCFYSYY